ncbi:c-type cytochrome biogenesis protein CcsB [Corticimicrobacter populi]|uniref:C-type cytochrome biogenesis protein CcsB n=1 Tax=Corticimicrobacter populi TaxID=2175229 RepID=A0A2V1JUP5_9BURK|nr:c-type cytochrome biogenesis protein CcsB [Corticimicrobacter populi]PWF21804.1 c-type cytochrome biogenesis protein CcsB [Corticimicrobacter populi]QDQ88601.1 c-type cytochrome biogenesis protein CcsB [Alcaligenaceae bacterium SJ-26]
MSRALASASQDWVESISETGDARQFRGRPDWTDLVFLLLLAAGTWYALTAYGYAMDGYEKVILVCTVPVVAWLGWLWRPLRTLMVAVALASLLGVLLYQDDLGRADSVFWLKYLFSSQSAILWMSCLFVLATVCYWIGFVSPTAAWLGTALTWGGVFAGFTGLMVRWREGHLMGPDMGHIPVSNLYEVFVLFALVTALFYLYYERRYATRALGGFVMLVVASMVVFLFWYSLTRDAQQIQPLVPALKSWWMKLHVPANFIGYGTFSLAAMVGFAYLVKENGESRSWRTLVPLFIMGVLLMAEPMVFRTEGLSATWAIYFGLGAIVAGGILLARRPIAARLPSLEVLDDIMYRAIAVGFAFFTVATILGALWAADAWGAYWQWDPKETWALIVWLNYAAWLHMRLIKGLRGTLAAYWALVGLLITGFAFLGVNMFLSGLHSYGEL